MRDPLRALQAIVSRQVFARGEHYWLEDRVIELETDGASNRYVAQVDGTHWEPYEVHLELHPKGWRGHCDCPADDPCKHFVAAALEIIETEQASHVDSPAETLDADRRAAQAAMTQWAKAHAKPTEASPVRTRKATERKGPNKRLEFVLDLVHRLEGAEVMVVPHEVSLRKDGSAGRHKPYASGRRYGMRTRDPAWLSPDDAILLYRLELTAETTRDRNGATLPRTAAGTRLLWDLVQTGRCHFRAIGPRRLTAGAARRCEPTWIPDDVGTQALSLVSADDDHAALHLLPLVPPHYLDETTGTCGPADTGLADTALEAFAAAPVVPAAGSRELAPAFRAALRRHGLPTPTPIDVAVIEQPAFVPAVWATYVDDTIVVQLAFEYDGHRIAAGDPEKIARVREGDRLHILPREPVLERAARLRLGGQGWFPLDSAESMFGTDARGPDPQRVATLLQLRGEGWHVELDADLGGTTVPIEAWTVDVTPTEDAGWFDLALGIDVEGERIDLLPILMRAIASGELTRDRLRLPTPLRVDIGQGRAVEVPTDRLEEILGTVGELLDTRGDGVRLHALSLEAIAQWSWTDAKLRRRLAALAPALRRGKPPRVRPPKGLQATLRDYQHDGLDWLQLLRTADAGGVLADDMGLGKTVQALTHVLVEKLAGRLRDPALVVAPRSVLRNWEREAARFTPALRTAVYHGPDRAAVLTEPVDLIVTTYALLTRDAALRERPWHVVVLDEAQAIKNPKAKVTRAAAELSANQRLCMTGTPVENHLGELWSIMSFAMPGLLGDWRTFSSAYRRPIEKEDCAQTMQALSRRLAPFMLRRTKADVLSELPPKTEVTRHAVLSAAERDLYESIRLTMEQRVREAMSVRGLARSQIVVLDALLKLRQVCCDGRLTDLAAARRLRSGAKLDLLMELLDQLVSEGRGVLVFSQFTSMLALITERLHAHGIEHMKITGRTAKRQPIIDRFQAGEFPVLLVSLKAGGTGLNLTAADTVIHYDPWWNPAVESQATDRAHRIGQTRPVTVYRLVCEGTVEERMLDLQGRKRELASAVQAGAEGRSAGGLSLQPEDIESLLAPLSR
jgi:superfamily II DNA or RNA helicase